MPGGAATDQPFRLKRSQAGIISCMSNDGREIKTYVCLHVFDGVRPVFYVTRPDGDCGALCGADRPDDASQFRVVGLGHIVDNDPTIEEVLDLSANGEAERKAVGEPWARSTL